MSFPSFPSEILIDILLRSSRIDFATNHSLLFVSKWVYELAQPQLYTHDVVLLSGEEARKFLSQLTEEQGGRIQKMRMPKNDSDSMGSEAVRVIKFCPNLADLTLNSQLFGLIPSVTLPLRLTVAGPAHVNFASNFVAVTHLRLTGLHINSSSASQIVQYLPHLTHLAYLIWTTAAEAPIAVLTAQRLLGSAALELVVVVISASPNKAAALELAFEEVSSGDPRFVALMCPHRGDPVLEELCQTKTDGGEIWARGEAIKQTRKTNLKV